MSLPPVGARLLYVPSNRARSDLRPWTEDSEPPEFVQPGVSFGLHRGRLVPQGRCGYCGVHSLPLTRDHIVARAFGGPDHEDNYLYCCLSCNGLRGVLPLRSFIGSPSHVRRLRKVHGPGFKSLAPKALGLIEAAIRRAERLPRRRPRQQESTQTLLQCFDHWLHTLSAGTLVTSDVLAAQFGEVPARNLPSGFVWRDRIVRSRDPCWEQGPRDTVNPQRSALQAACLLCGAREACRRRKVMASLVGGTEHPDNLIDTCGECTRRRGRLPLLSHVTSEAHRERLREVWGPSVSRLAPVALQMLGQRVTRARLVRTRLVTHPVEPLQRLARQWVAWFERLPEGAWARFVDFGRFVNGLTASLRRLARRHLPFDFRVVRSAYASSTGRLST